MCLLNETICIIHCFTSEIPRNLHHPLPLNDHDVFVDFACLISGIDNWWNRCRTEGVATDCLKHATRCGFLLLQKGLSAQPDDELCALQFISNTSWREAKNQPDGLTIQNSRNLHHPNHRHIISFSSASSCLQKPLPAISRSWPKPTRLMWGNRLVLLSKTLNSTMSVSETS